MCSQRSHIRIKGEDSPKIAANQDDESVGRKIVWMEGRFSSLRNFSELFVKTLDVEWNPKILWVSGLKIILSGFMTLFCTYVFPNLAYFFHAYYTFSLKNFFAGTPFRSSLKIRNTWTPRTWCNGTRRSKKAWRMAISPSPMNMFSPQSGTSRLAWMGREGWITGGRAST